MTYPADDSPSPFHVTGIAWAGIGTDRYDDTLALMLDVLGLTVETSVPGQAILRAGGQQVEIFGRAGPGKTRNTPPAFAFEVDDFDAALAALTKAGVPLEGEPGQWAEHRWQYFRTPDGYLLSIKTSRAGE